MTIAWLEPNTRVGADNVPAFLKTMHATVGELAAPAQTAAAENDEPLPSMCRRSPGANHLGWRIGRGRLSVLFGEDVELSMRLAEIRSGRVGCAFTNKHPST